MMLISISLLTLTTILVLIQGAVPQCPSPQKFTSSSSKSCSTNSRGEDKTINCSTITSIEKYTVAAWVKYPSDPGSYTGAEDVIFSVYDPAEGFRRLTLEYKFATGK